MSTTSILPSPPKGYPIQKVLKQVKAVKGNIRYRCYCGLQAQCSPAEWKAGLDSCKCRGGAVPFPAKDRIGFKAGKLTVVQWLGLDADQHLWQCKCECGALMPLTDKDLAGRKIKDCGCVQREAEAEGRRKASRAVAQEAKRTEREDGRARRLAEQEAARKAKEEAKKAAKKAREDEKKAAAEAARKAKFEERMNRILAAQKERERKALQAAKEREIERARRDAEREAAKEAARQAKNAAVAKDKQRKEAEKAAIRRQQQLERKARMAQKAAEVKKTAQRWQSTVERRKAEAAKRREDRIEQYRRAMEAKATAEARAAEYAQQQRAEREARVAALKTVFKLTPAAHLRSQKHAPAQFKKATPRAITVGDKRVEYRCYCGDKAVCSRSQWNAGITECHCRGLTCPLPYYDLKGLKVGQLKVGDWLSSDVSGKGRVTHHYQARCSCGEAMLVTSVLLARESLMLCKTCRDNGLKRWSADPAKNPLPEPTHLGLAGARFGKVTVTEFAEGYVSNTWQYTCDCGSHEVATTGDLLAGRIQECRHCANEAAEQANSALSEEEKQAASVLAKLRRPELVATSSNGERVGYKCFCGRSAKVDRMDWEAGVEVCRCDTVPVHLPTRDLTGLMVGQLEVMTWKGRSGRGLAWECRCGCGNLVVVAERDLIHRERLHCGCLAAGGVKVKPVKAGMPRLGRPAAASANSALEGQTFGLLRVLGMDANTAGKVLCRCSCGQYVRVGLSSLKAGRVTSCGCQPLPDTGPGRPPVLERLSKAPELAAAG